jgi:hypothetical protein
MPPTDPHRTGSRQPIASVHVCDFVSVLSSTRWVRRASSELARVPGAQFAKVTTCFGTRSSAGFSPYGLPEVRRVIAILVWEEESALEEFLNRCPLAQAWRECRWAWHTRTAPLQSRGSFRGHSPLSDLPRSAPGQERQPRWPDRRPHTRAHLVAAQPHAGPHQPRRQAVLANRRSHHRRVGRTARARELHVHAVGVSASDATLRLRTATRRSPRDDPPKPKPIGTDRATLSTIHAAAHRGHLGSDTHTERGRARAARQRAPQRRPETHLRSMLAAAIQSIMAQGGGAIPRKRGPVRPGPRHPGV